MLEYRLFSTQKKCALYKTRSVVCRGYVPPEFIENHIVSKKFDIFSLGVVMIKIVTGAEGYHRHLDMPRDEFIDLVTNAVSCTVCMIVLFFIIITNLIFQVRVNWRRRLQSTFRGSTLDAYCKQVKTCTEIALDCLEDDRYKRPDTVDITLTLKQTEAHKVRCT